MLPVQLLSWGSTCGIHPPGHPTAALPLSVLLLRVLGLPPHVPGRPRPPRSLSPPRRKPPSTFIFIFGSLHHENISMSNLLFLTTPAHMGEERRAGRRSKPSGGLTCPEPTATTGLSFPPWTAPGRAPHPKLGQSVLCNHMREHTPHRKALHPHCLGAPPPTCGPQQGAPREAVPARGHHA